MNCGPGWLAKLIPQRGHDCTFHDHAYERIARERKEADRMQRNRMLIEGKMMHQSEWRYRFRAWRWHMWMRIFGRFVI